MNKPLGIGAVLAILASSCNAQNTTGPAGQPLFWKNILDSSQLVGKTCTDYNTGFFNAVTGDIVRCTRSAGFTAGVSGNYIAVSGGGGGSSIWGGITGTLSNQSDLQAALNGKQATLTLPLSVANGGTGTSSPLVQAGTGISISGTWPNLTIANTGSGGGGGGIASGTTLPGTCTVGAAFIKTNGAPNQQFYVCSATNTWTLNLLLGGSGALGIDGTTGALDIVTSVLPRTNASNAFTGRNSFTLSDYIMQGAPAASASGKLTLYANSDGSLHYINSAGTDSPLATGAGFANPMTTQDDVIVAGTSGTPTRLPKGADNQVLGIDPGTHHLTYINGGGGSGSAAGPTYSVQTNSSGAFTGSSEFTYGDPAMGGAAIHKAGVTGLIMWDTDDTTAGGNFIVLNSGTADGAGGNNRKFILEGANAGNGGILSNSLDIRDESTGTDLHRMIMRADGRVAVGGDGVVSSVQTDDQQMQSFGVIASNDGLMINSPNQAAACDASHRGLFKFVKSGTGVSDHVDICAKNGSDVYAFVRLF